MVAERLWLDYGFSGFGLGNGGANLVFGRTIVLDDPFRQVGIAPQCGGNVLDSGECGLDVGRVFL